MFAPRFSDIYSFGKVRSEVSCYEDLRISEEEEDENCVVMENSHDGLKIDPVAYIKRLLALNDTSSYNHDYPDGNHSHLPAPGW